MPKFAVKLEKTAMTTTRYTFVVDSDDQEKAVAQAMESDEEKAVSSIVTYRQGSDGYELFDVEEM